MQIKYLPEMDSETDNRTHGVLICQIGNHVLLESEMKYCYYNVEVILE